MRFYLIRHGQTQWNTEGRIQGKTDIPLDETGLRQAELLQKGMTKYRLDAIYSSPLKRALETARAVARGRGSFEDKNCLGSGALPIRILDGLRERDFGLWEGLPWDTIREQYGEDFLAWERNPIDGTPTGGERREECEARCRKAVETMIREQAEGDAESGVDGSGSGPGCGQPGGAGSECGVAVVAHGGILVFLISYLLRNQKEEREIIVRNASISIVDYDVERGLGRLIALNETGHLGKMSNPLRWELEKAAEPEESTELAKAAELVKAMEPEKSAKLVNLEANAVCPPATQ